MFRCSHHNFSAVRLRCNLQRTWRSCFSAAYVQISAQTAQKTSYLWLFSFVLILQQFPYCCRCLAMAVSSSFHVTVLFHRSDHETNTYQCKKLCISTLGGMSDLPQEKLTMGEIQQCKYNCVKVCDLLHYICWNFCITFMEQVEKTITLIPFASIWISNQVTVETFCNISIFSRFRSVMLFSLSN